MSVFTIAWLLIGVAVLVIEAIALLNSTPGDTLSEHVWAWTGVRRRESKQINQDEGPPYDARVQYNGPNFIAPRWTLRVARSVILLGMVWLATHFLTGGWV